MKTMKSGRKKLVGYRLYDLVNVKAVTDTEMNNVMGSIHDVVLADRQVFCIISLANFCPQNPTSYISLKAKKMNGIKIRRKGRRSLMRSLMKKKRKAVLLKWWSWVGQPSVSNMVFVRDYRCFSISIYDAGVGNFKCSLFYVAEFEVHDTTK